MTQQAINSLDLYRGGNLTMDYEQKYKEALKRAKMYQGMVVLPAESMIETIFPELRESEDERIRKAIHIYLDWLDGRNKDYQPKGDYSIKDMIAWLEKQGQNPTWSEEDENGLGDALWCCKQAASIAKDENDIGNVWYAEQWLKAIKNRIKGE